MNNLQLLSTFANLAILSSAVPITHGTSSNSTQPNAITDDETFEITRHISSTSTGANATPMDPKTRYIVIALFGAIFIGMIIAFCIYYRRYKRNQLSVGDPVQQTGFAGPQQIPTGVAFVNTLPNDGLDDNTRGNQFCQQVPIQPNILFKAPGFIPWRAPSSHVPFISFAMEGSLTVISTAANTPMCTMFTEFPLRYGGNNGDIIYNVHIKSLDPESRLAIGLGCLPYPIEYRLPGWHRESLALRNDGTKYANSVSEGETFMKGFQQNDLIQLRYDGATGNVSYIQNGAELGTAFFGQFRHDHDVFGQLGVCGRVELEIETILVD